jgi:polysaccharide biosynthesis protein PslH
VNSSSKGQTRILYVTPVWPNGSVTGVHVRALNVLRALQQIGIVETLLLEGEDASSVKSSELQGDRKPAYTVPVTARRNDGLIAKWKWMLDPKADYPHGCRAPLEEMNQILGVANKFDLIWFFKARSADVFPNSVWPRSVLDIDDLESRYESSKLRAGSGLLEDLLTIRRLVAWKRREKLFGQRFTVLTVCSEDDRDYLTRLGLRIPIHVVPNGFERPTVEPVRQPARPPRIGFIGPLDYPPNSDGVRWFVKYCWPRIKSRIPDVRLRLAGPGSDGHLKPVGTDIDGLGWLPDPSEEIKTWSLMIVPLRVGGGTRVKIAYGFSQKCPVVSTQLGAHGYGARSGYEMCLADSPEGFADACITLLCEPERAAGMAERAWHQYLEKWTWEAIQASIWEAAEDCLRKGQGSH